MRIEIKPDKKIASVCGLFCSACGIYNSTQENNEENLKRIAARMNIPYDEVRCNGCRSGVVTAYCKDCYMEKCAAEKNIDFCGECDEYPCANLKEFQSKMPHRVDIWKSQERIKETGWENWFTEMIEYYSCSECGALNGWYDFKCRSCGNTPGSDFVKNNFETLKTVIR